MEEDGAAVTWGRREAYVSMRPVYSWDMREDKLDERGMTVGG